MKRQQLYINGMAVDMPTDEIKISVPSNIMSDAGSIMTAHSYSLTLPRTMTNDSIMHNAYVPAADTSGKSTHRYMKASLYIDGVPMFDGGRCVVDSVEDKGYKCSLFWGLLGLFDDIKDEGLNLCDLVCSKFVSGEDATIWYNLLDPDTHLPINPHNYVSGMSQDIYNTLNDDSKALARRLPWGLPVITANDVLGAITGVYGLQFDISAEAQSRINKIYHAPTTLKCLADEEKCVINLRTAWIKQGSNYRLNIINMDENANNFCDYIYLSPLMYDHPPFSYHSTSNKWQANNALVSAIAGETLVANSKIVVEKLHVWGHTNYPFILQYNGATYYSSNNAMDETIDEEVSFDKVAQILRIYSNSTGTSTTPSTINVQLWLKEIDLSDGCSTNGGNWWSEWRNLPQMTAIDYINELLAHIGGCCVGSVTKKSTLRITTWDEVAANTPQAIDALGVKSIKMQFEKLAQRNKYTHKENDDNGVKYLGEGYTYTEDTTLDLEATAFESKFKVPMNTMVRLWKVEKDKDSSKYSASWAGGDDYILGYDNGAGICRNTGQDFANTIESYYTPYKTVTKYPKVIEITVRLTLLELIAFDFERMVYVPQIGRQYFVTKIDSEGGDNYKLTMLQI